MSKEKRIIKKLKEYPLEENVDMDKDEFEEYLDAELEKVNKDLEDLDEEIKLLEKEIEERGEYKPEPNERSNTMECPECEGTGEIRTERWDGLTLVNPCRECDGTGEIKYADMREEEDMGRRHDDRDMDDNKIIGGA